MTILAARRVLPPDLIVPADASAPRMKLTGPRRGAAALQVLVPTSGCCERLMPDAGAALEDRALLPYQLRIESIVSSTARMKQRRRLLRARPSRRC